MRYGTLVVSFLFLIMLPWADTAEAKRFGGGSLLGKSYSTPAKPKPTPSKQVAPTEKTSTAGKTGKAGFGGMLAGVMAGGLFGALLFGGAFEGLQWFDLILVAGLIFLAYKLFFRSHPQSSSAQTSGGQQFEINPSPSPVESAPVADSPMPATGGWGNNPVKLTLPDWFDKPGFLQRACKHFTHLQQAWDRCDWEEIRSYCSPELFDQLQQERSKLPQDQVTEVVSVMADVVGFVQHQSEVVISVHFYGWLREDVDETTEFSEVWHLTRSMASPDADWFIVGIEQN